MDVATLERQILRKLRQPENISRCLLAERLDIARSTAGRRVDSLIKRGLLHESGVESRAGVGRPRRYLEFNPDHGGFMGLDFDARRVHGVVIDFAHRLIFQQSVKLPANPSTAQVIKKIRALEKLLAGKAGELSILGIGLGVPGRVHRETLTALEYPYIRAWKDIELPTELGLDADLMVIENNTRVGALGEYWFGQNAGAADLLCLNIRTGISASVIANGSLVSGNHEIAGEIRRWPTWNPMSDKFGSSSLEDSATIRAISKHAESPEDADWKTFCSACKNGESKALKKLSAIASMHAGAAAMALQLTDPQVVVINGWFIELGELYLKRVETAAVRGLEKHWLPKPAIQLSALGEYAGAMGAAALASESYVPK